MHTMRKLEGKMTLTKVNWGGIVEIGGKVGRLLSGGVDTRVEDERRPLFKTSWSRSPADTVALHSTFGSL